MESGNVDDNQFLFNEAEFEAEDFRAGSFVAKYRRVTTLESIRLQLHQCVEGLKNQLYVIINRDYKDFISIATKLDGVDTRIEFLRKPLVDLRIDLTNVHEGMIATIQAIQDKLQRKTDVTNRRIMLELVIECSDKLDIADEIINGNKRSFQVYTQSRRDLLVCIANDDEKKDIFPCSELERCAFALNRVKCLLKELSSVVDTKSDVIFNSRSVLKTSDFLDYGAGASNDSINILVTKLSKRCQQIQDSLVIKLQSKLSSMFSNLHLQSSQVTSFPKFAFIHTVRALSVIRRADVLEAVLEQIVVSPIVRSCLSQGRVDGDLNNSGPFIGLNEAFIDLLAQLQHFLREPLCILEELPDSFESILLNGVWRPIASHLRDKYPTMFNLAIPDKFAYCYCVYENFKYCLAGIAGSQFHSKLLLRLHNSDAVQTIDKLWRIDLYYHLRQQEIYQRVDIVCNHCYQHGITTSVPILGDDSCNIEFQLPVLKFYSNELLRCVNGRVMLRPVRGRMVVIVLQLLTRLEAHVCVCADVNPVTSQLNKSNLLSAVQQTIMNPDNSISSNQPTNLSTPAKKVSESSSQTVTPSTGAKHTSTFVVSTVNSVDELVLLAADLLAFKDWLRDCLSQSLAKAIMSDNKIADLAMENVHTQLQSSILHHVNALTTVCHGVWVRAVSIVGMESKRNLGGVKVITGKYRMTNKPPPDSASAYVETVLQPLKLFMSNSNLNRLLDIGVVDLDLSNWKGQFLDDITSYYLQQVQLLMETVKQMDSALQRRNKTRSTSNMTNLGMGMSDSDKISLQVYLDVIAYGKEVREVLGENILDELQSWKSLLNELQDAARLVVNNP